MAKGRGLKIIFIGQWQLRPCDGHALQQLDDDERFARSRSAELEFGVGAVLWPLDWLSGNRVGIQAQTFVEYGRPQRCFARFAVRRYLGQARGAGRDQLGNPIHLLGM